MGEALVLGNLVMVISPGKNGSLPRSNTNHLWLQLFTATGDDQYFDKSGIHSYLKCTEEGLQNTCLGRQFEYSERK